MWKERGTIRFIPELVHNLASALALRAPLEIKKNIVEKISRQVAAILIIGWKLKI